MPSPPVRFASSVPLTADDLSAAPLRSIPRPSRLAEPLDLPERAAQAAASVGLETVGDLLEHMPFRHRQVHQIALLPVGEEATVVASVLSIARRRTRRGRTIVEARVADASGQMTAIWFNQPWLVDRLPPGTEVTLNGRLEARRRFGVRGYELGGGDNGGGATFAGVYSTTRGVPEAKLRERLREAQALLHETLEPLPARIRTGQREPDRPAALAAVHFPADEDEGQRGRERLAFEELLLHELALRSRRRASADSLRAPALPPAGALLERWRASLPFELTGDQRAATREIDAELAGERPMQRLLMGEVGSGKTVVALHAMLRAVEAGRQAALMAPTETLAEQHLATLDRLLGGAMPIELLTGSTPAARRRALLERLRSGELSLVVGTHALIEPAVEFRSLALCVVDEQHRFGVRQRAALEAKAPEALVPHVLHMTATPIPRTLQLTEYGDLDKTALHELPAGRRPIETFVVDGARARARAYELARAEIAAGRQVFVVCPLVEESEALQAKAATSEYDRLRRTEFADQRVALIHGQLPAREKAEAMRAFAAGSADVLVATSVIEVGIDVPNATIMIVEAAERYGLSQLHQLRGRIGRGPHRSICILFGDPRLRRLEALATESDGFRLAEIDLELRGAGEVLGTRQHGLATMRFARLPDDEALLERAVAVANAVLDADPRLDAPENALLVEAARARFGPELDPIPA